MSFYNMAPCHTCFLSDAHGPPYLNIFPLDSICHEFEEIVVVDELTETVLDISEEFLNN